MQSRLIRLIGVVFSNSTMLSVSDKSDSVNKCVQEISKLMKLHIQGVWQNAHKFTRQLTHWACQFTQPMLIADACLHSSASVGWQRCYLTLLQRLSILFVNKLKLVK